MYHLRWLWSLWSGRLTSLTDLDIVSAHLTLPHLAILCEGPVLETVTAFPLHAIVRILIFIPGSVSGRVLPHEFTDRTRTEQRFCYPRRRIIPCANDSFSP